MKNLVLLSSLILLNSCLWAQSDTITSRDTIQFGYQIKNNIIPDFERVLNFIADKTTAPNEVDEIINNKTKGGKEIRLFTDAKIIVENDLIPGADTNKLLKADLNVVQYLNGFNTSYAKSEDKTIFFTILSKSDLKKSTYFYYNVLFECSYQGTNSDGAKFTPFNRVAEVKVVFDETWHLYINSVYFPHGTEMDEKDNFKDVVVTETDIEKILNSYDNEEQRRAREEKNKMITLIDEGDDKFESGDYEAALKKYREARMLNFYNKQPQDKIKQAKMAMAQQYEKANAKQDREKHIAAMKLGAFKEYNNFNFKQAKVLIDSLINEFNISDTEIDGLNTEVSQINSALVGIESAMDHGKLKEAVKNCEGKIKEAKSKSKIYNAELYYRMAVIYLTLDKSEKNRIMEALGQAITISGNHHQEALRARVKMYLSSGEVDDISHAVQDATQIINNDSRNPSNYVLRAGIYEKDKNPVKAIEDYGKAITYKTSEKTTFLNKAILEYTTGKYYEVVKTADDGLTKTDCYGLLYFYRCLAKEKLKYYQEAGEDFAKAAACGLPDSSKKVLVDISAGYLKTGTDAFLQAQYKLAITDLTKSILLDKNENAFYYRGRSYISTGKNDSAVSDLSALLVKKPDYRDARSQRGVAFTNLDRIKEAVADFDDELNKYSDNSSAYYSKGMALFKQKKYTDAANCFIQSAGISYSDSAFYMASVSYYQVKNYSKAISNSLTARKNGTKKFEVFYVCGRSYYDIGNYSEALKEFEKAKKLVSYDEDLFFWFALTLEASKDFALASASYDLLSTSKKYKDTILFRSAVCLVSTHDELNYNKAVGKFVRYNITDNNTDNSEANAWAAYAYLNTGEIDKAVYCIEIAKKANEQCAMLQYVMACYSSKTNKYEEALIFLENAVKTLNWSKKEYESELLLKELRKNRASKDKYNKIMEQVKK